MCGHGPGLAPRPRSAFLDENPRGDGKGSSMSRQASTLRGTKGPIRIGRNDEGVAVVSAGDVVDAQYGLGYCHGRDRGLQMRLLRILGRGEAAERLRDTDEMVEIDRFFRRLNFCGDAAEQEAELTPRARSGCQAYCAGVSQAFRDVASPWELRL